MRHRQHKNFASYEYEFKVRYLSMYLRHFSQDIQSEARRTKLLRDHWKSGVLVNDAVRGIHETEVLSTS